MSVSLRPDGDNTSTPQGETPWEEATEVVPSVQEPLQEEADPACAREAKPGAPPTQDQADSAPSLSEQERVRRRYEELTSDETYPVSDAPDARELSDRIWAYCQRNWRMIALCLLGLAGFNYWEQMVEDNMRVVEQLEQQRDDMRKRLLFITADLASMQRISNIEQSVQELGLPLEHSFTPPYEINVVRPPKE